jgi:hypothetical protein
VLGWWLWLETLVGSPHDPARSANGESSDDGGCVVSLGSRVTGLRPLILVSLALGVLVLAAVPLHAAVRADPRVLSDDDYLEPACRVPFPVFPEPVCPRVVAGESPLTLVYALIAVPLLGARGGRRGLLLIAITSAGLAALQLAAPFAFTYPPAGGGRRPSALEPEPGCGLVNCGLDHTVFHLAQLPFLVALAVLAYRLYQAAR